jgi:hypothetical protein
MFATDPWIVRELRKKSAGSGSGGGNYTLPKAATNTLGGIKVGTTLFIDSEGVLNVDPSLRYTHPQGDGNLHVPVTGNNSNNKILKAGSSPGLFSWQFLKVADITDFPTAFSPSQHASTHLPNGTDALPFASSTVDGFMSKADKAKLDGISNNANLYSLPVATGSLLGGIKQGSNVTIDANGVLSVASPYVPPTGDGNMTVTATGTTNYKKVLTAGATAGSFGWSFYSFNDLTENPFKYNNGNIGIGEDADPSSEGFKVRMNGNHNSITGKTNVLQLDGPDDTLVIFGKGTNLEFYDELVDTNLNNTDRISYATIWGQHTNSQIFTVRTPKTITANYNDGTPSWWRESTITIFREDAVSNGYSLTDIEFVDFYNMSWPVTNSSGQQIGIDAGHGIRGVASVLNGDKTQKVRGSRLRNFYFDFSDYNPVALKAMSVKPNDTTLIGIPATIGGKYPRTFGHNRTSVQIHKRLEIGEVYDFVHDVATNDAPHWIQESGWSGYLSYQNQGIDESVWEVSTPPDTLKGIPGNANMSAIRAAKYKNSAGLWENIEIYNDGYPGEEACGLKMTAIVNADFPNSTFRPFKFIFGKHVGSSWTWSDAFQIKPYDSFAGAGNAAIWSMRHEFSNSNTYIERGSEGDLEFTDTIMGTKMMSDFFYETFIGGIGVGAHTWDWKTERNKSIRLTGNTTLSITNAFSGMYATLIVQQDATGSRTLTLPAGSKVAGGGGAITLSTSPNAFDIISVVFNGINFFFNYSKNYN